MSRTLVDGHVHFHACFSLPDFLNAARQNFRLANAGACTGVLLLTQIGPDDPLEAIRRGLRNLPACDTECPEPTSVVISIEDDQLVLIAGRQVVTAEKLELLSLCSKESVENGMRLEKSLQVTESGGGVPALPWGFGKWWFARGQRIRDLLANSAASTTFLLGDNGCRPRLVRPVLLAAAEEVRIPVLAGSDPLPIPSHVHRPGCFGSILPDAIDLQAPTQWMKQQLRALDRSPESFGVCRTAGEFVADQFRIRFARS